MVWVPFWRLNFPDKMMKYNTEKLSFSLNISFGPGPREFIKLTPITSRKYENSLGKSKQDFPPSCCLLAPGANPR